MSTNFTPKFKFCESQIFEDSFFSSKKISKRFLRKSNELINFHQGIHTYSYVNKYETMNHQKMREKISLAFPRGEKNHEGNSDFSRKHGLNYIPCTA